MRSMIEPAIASGRCHLRILQPQPLQSRKRRAPVTSAKHDQLSLLPPRPVAHQARSLSGCRSCSASDLLHGARLNGSKRRQSSVGPLSSVGAAFAGFQGSAASISSVLASVSPPFYLVYMLAAGFGLPCSEDALVVWAGAGMATGRYGGWPGILQVVGILYFGVVVSDLVTFWLGAALRRGLFSSLKERLFKDPAMVERAEAVVRKRSQAIGLVQRFSLGFRGPLCLVAGFTGVSSAQFAAGVAIGAVGTMALQIFAGYMLRDSPNAYLAALALVAGPNLVGHLAGPVLTALGLWTASRPPTEQAGEAQDASTGSSTAADTSTAVDVGAA